MSHYYMYQYSLHALVVNDLEGKGMDEGLRTDSSSIPPPCNEDILNENKI